jgi:hypothetical protein
MVLPDPSVLSRPCPGGVPGALLIISSSPCSCLQATWSASGLAPSERGGAGHPLVVGLPLEDL